MSNHSIGVRSWRKNVSSVKLNMWHSELNCSLGVEFPCKCQLLKGKWEALGDSRSGSCGGVGGGGGGGRGRGRGRGGGESGKEYWMLNEREREVYGRREMRCVCTKWKCQPTARILRRTWLGIGYMQLLPTLQPPILITQCPLVRSSIFLPSSAPTIFFFTVNIDIYWYT